MKLLPFQREFIKAVENSKYDTVAISGPRSLGKTFIAAEVLIRCLDAWGFTSISRGRNTFSGRRRWSKRD